MTDKTSTSYWLHTTAKAAENKWLKLYVDSVNSTDSYYERDRLYAKVLSAREASRASRGGGDVLGGLQDTVMRLKADWVLYPTAEKEGRFEGLQQIIDAVEEIPEHLTLHYLKQRVFM